jgi:hypothetical protein
MAFELEFVWNRDLPIGTEIIIRSPAEDDYYRVEECRRTSDFSFWVQASFSKRAGTASIQPELPESPERLYDRPTRRIRLRDD